MLTTSLPILGNCLPAHHSTGGGEEHDKPQSDNDSTGARSCRSNWMHPDRSSIGCAFSSSFSYFRPLPLGEGGLAAPRPLPGGWGAGLDRPPPMYGTSATSEEVQPHDRIINHWLHNCIDFTYAQSAVIKATYTASRIFLLSSHEYMRWQLGTISWKVEPLTNMAIML